jgi:two-component system, LytTR family, sensor histidine kinase LytS
MIENIYANIALNIAVLLIMGNAIPRIPFFRRTLFRYRKSWTDIILLSLVFGGLGILSTYLGINVNGAIVNTRVIGVITGGFLGGPWVGFLSGLIAGGHRYLYDLGGFTALSCGISTLVEGILGGLMANTIRTTRNKYAWIYGITFIAEILQMLIILLIARPFDAAVELVSIIAVPMVLLNSLGAVVFVEAIFSVQRNIDLQSAKQLKVAFDIAKATALYTRKGLESDNDMLEVTRIVRERSESRLVMITTLERVVAINTTMKPEVILVDAFLPIIRDLKDSDTIKQLNAEEIRSVGLSGGSNRVFIAPISRFNITVGFLIIGDRNYQESVNTTTEFIEGLARLLSTQLELSEIEYQKKLVSKAELKLLQSQINPHFLFNALNTIAATSRLNPHRARQLILALASYFRSNLSAQKEMIDIHSEIEHVLSYIEIEMARFEDRLNVKIDCDPNLRWEVPNFIIQPLVENSIKHGMKKETLQVEVKVSTQDHHLLIEVVDDGGGIAPEVIQRLHSPLKENDKIGLTNIHQRLKSIYPNHPGLQITTDGTTSTHIRIMIPEGSVR